MTKNKLAGRYEHVDSLLNLGMFSSIQINVFALHVRCQSITNNIDMVEGSEGIANSMWSIYVDMEDFNRIVRQVPFLV